MFNVILIMSVGIIIGSIFHKNKNLIRLSERITTYTIWSLLFLLGLEIGTNEVIVENIGTLGIKAFIISFGAILGSVLLSYFLYNFLFKNDR